MAMPGLFPGQDLRRRCAEERYQLCQRGGDLMFQGNLTDAAPGRIGPCRVHLPENVQKDIPISGIGGMLMGRPIRGMTVELHVTGEGVPIVGGKSGTQEIGAGPAVPDPGVVQPNRLPGQSDQRIPDQLLKPDPLEDGFRQNGCRLLPKKIRPNPPPIAEAHQD